MEFLCSKMENVCYNGIKKILGGILVENRRKSDVAIGKNMADMRSKFNLTQKRQGRNYNPIGTGVIK